jgi:hypothetical protein
VSAFKGTPGPWVVNNDSEDYYVYTQRRVDERGYAPICEITWQATKGEHHTWREPEVKANAVAIAQVPAMVEALVAIAAAWEGEPWPANTAKAQAAMKAYVVLKSLREGGAL